MTAATVTRRVGKRIADVPEWWRYDHHSDGLIVDPARCPLRRRDRAHWHQVDGAEPGAPNAVCDHEIGVGLAVVTGAGPHPSGAGDATDRKAVGGRAAVASTGPSPAPTTRPPSEEIHR